MGSSRRVADASAKRRISAAALRVAFDGFVIAGIVWSTCAHALPGPADDNNTFKNVGAAFLVDSSNNIVGFCSGTLIHERLFLTAGHCLGLGPIPEGLRGFVSFAPLDARNSSTWIEGDYALVHPSMADVPALTGGVSDVGLVVLTAPVKDIPPAPLAAAGTLNALAGASMTVVGYGCGPVSSWDGVRKVGTYALFDVYNAEWARFIPNILCGGDSGAPTFYEGRIVAVTSDGGSGYAYQARVDIPSVLDWIQSVIASLSPNVDLNQHGLTGSWYEPATRGQGLEVEVFPDQLAPGTGSVQVSWFTFDPVIGAAERQRWYTLSGPVVTGQANATLKIYQNVGGNFNALPITTAQQVGTATLSFDTCSNGQLSYNFTDGSARTGSIPLTRLTQNVTCSTSSARPTNADFALSGNWYDRVTSGQGLTIEVNQNSGTVFAAWYTYAPNAAGAGAAGQRWYTAQPPPSATFIPGSRSIPLTIYETTGGMFDTPTSPGQQTGAVGSGTLTFQNCSAATFGYTFTGGSSSGSSGTINLQRVGPVPSGCTS